MRILIDARIANRDTTGISRTAHHLIKHLLLQDRQNEYTVFCSRYDPFPKIKRDNITKKISQLSDRPILRNLWELFVLPFSLWRCKADLFFSPNNFVSPWFPVKAKIVVTVHDIIPFVLEGYSRNWFKRQYFFIKAKIALRMAKLVVVDSEFTKSDLVSKLGVDQESVRVVHLGIAKDFCAVGDGEVPKKFGLKRPFILGIGGSEWRKNIQILIDAYGVARTKNSRFSYDLVVVGDTSTEDKPFLTHRLEVPRGIRNCVHLVGRVSDEDLKGLYTGASVFVCSSVYEGFGFPILEVMSCGTPVICSDTTSLPEVAGSAAILFNPKDAEELAQSIRKVLSDNVLREELISKGKERVKFFSWERSAQRLLRVLGEVGLI